MKNFIEVHTPDKPYTINIAHIIFVEAYRRKSVESVINLSNGDCTFVEESYEDIKNMILEAQM